MTRHRPPKKPPYGGPQSSNDNDKPPASVTPIADRLAEITLSEQEKGMINALESNVGAAKMRLADVQMQILSLEQQRNAAAVKVAEAGSQLSELVRTVATAHGIDVDDMTKRWNLDTNKGVFTRTA